MGQAYDQASESGADGLMWVRRLFCDEYDNAVKAVAWVEKE